MKKWREWIKPVGALLLVCGVMGCLMAVTQALTKPIIEARAEDETDYKKELFPGAVFESIDMEGAKEAYRTSEGDWAFLMEAKGYNKSQPVELLIGIRADGSIAGIRVLVQAETEGIGARVLEDSHLQQYDGLQDIRNIDGISGATVTSKAVQNAIQAALELSQQAEGA